MRAGRQVLRSRRNSALPGHATHCEGGMLPRRHDIRGIARSPHLDERRVVEHIGRHALDAGMQRVQPGSWHAVLQAGPGRMTEGLWTRRKPLVERLDATSKG